MKSTLFFLVYFMGLGYLQAQEVNCVEKQKEFEESVSRQNFKQANELLSLLKKKCPSQNEAMYLMGITTLQYNIDWASDATKEIAVRDLLKFYDQYDANFPNNKNGNLVQKAMTLYDNKKGTDKEIYSFLDKAFSTSKEQFTSANALFIYFKLYYDSYTAKNSGVTFDQLLIKYTEVTAAIEKNSLAFPDKADEYKNADHACKSLLKTYLTLENLIASAEKGFETNSKNTEWLATTANLLSDKCAASPIFGKVATQLHQLQPTSKSAYHLGNYNLKSRNTKQAVAYFTQSATLATDASEKAKTYYTTAVIVAATDKGQAKKFITSAIENDAKNGSYYIFLANLYANSVNECGATSIEKKAIYQLANRTAQKASQVEPRLQPTATQFANEYAKNSPTKQELDQLNTSGGKVTIGCWINETVQF